MISYKEKVCRITFSKKENEPLCKFYNKHVDEAKKESFFKNMKINTKLNLFSNKYKNSKSPFIFISE